jgi:hypothetical protein
MPPFLVSPLRAICPAHLTVLAFVVRILCTRSLCDCLHLLFFFVSVLLTRPCVLFRLRINSEIINPFGHLAGLLRGGGGSVRRKASACTR